MAEEAERAARGDRGQHPGRVAIERERDGRERRGADHADAGGEPVDAVDQVDDVGHRDDPEDRRRARRGRPCRPAAARTAWSQPGSTPPTKGSVKTSTVTPACTGMIAAPIWPSSFSSGGRSTDVVDHARPRRSRAAPIRIARVCSSQGRKIAPEARTATRIAAPESFGVGATCRLRSTRPVDRADLPGQRLGDRHQDPGDRPPRRRRRRGRRSSRSSAEASQRRRRLRAPRHQAAASRAPSTRIAGSRGSTGPGSALALAQLELARRRRARRAGPRRSGARPPRPSGR